MSYEMVVVSFPGEEKADEVLHSLRALDSIEAVELDSAAIIVRKGDDSVAVKETKDYDVKQGAIVGAVGGMVLGAILGRGAVKGALVGAGAGAAAGKFIDLGLDDDFLNEIGDQVPPGSSAIVALIEFSHMERAMEELDKFEGGTILHHDLSDEAFAQLSAAVED